MAAQVITSAPIFNGLTKSGPTNATHLAAESYFVRITNSITANDNNYDDDKARVLAFIDGFREEAAHWFFNDLADRLTEDEYDELCKDYKEVQDAFKLKYFRYSTPNDASINWMGFKQKSDETAEQYMDRTWTGANRFSKLLVTPYSPTVDTNGVKRVFPDNNTWIDNLEAANDGANAGKLARAVTAGRKDTADYFQQRSRTIMKHQVLRVVLAGIRNPKVKTILETCIREDTKWRDAVAKVALFEKQHSNSHDNHVNALEDKSTYDHEDDFEQSKGVNAVRSRNGFRGRGRGGQRSQQQRSNNNSRRNDNGRASTFNSQKVTSTDGSYNPKIKCPFCANVGHEEPKCLSRKRIMENNNRVANNNNKFRQQRGNQSQSKNGDTLPHFSVSAANDGTAEDPVSNVSSALNSQLFM